MAVGGTVEAPTLGILDRDLAGVDLRDCGLHSPGLTAALDRIADWISDAGLTPYDVAARTRRAQARAADRVARRRAAAAAGGAVDGPRGAGAVAAACAAASGAGAARGDDQRAARAQGGARGRAGDRADRGGDAADAAGDRSDAAAGAAVVLPDQHPRRRGALRAGAGVGRRAAGRPHRVGPLLRRRRLRAPPRRRPGARCSASRCRPTRSTRPPRTAAELGVAAAFVAGGRDGVRPGPGRRCPTSSSSTRRGAASAPTSRAGWRRRACATSSTRRATPSRSRATSR